MITPLLILKLTVVLASAAVCLAICRPLDARFRNWLCTFSIVLALFLPLFGALGAAVPVPIPAVFTLASRSGASSAHMLHVPWHTVWLVGILLVAARNVAGLLYLASRTRKATPYRVVDSVLRMELNSVGASVRIAPVTAPLVWGWVNPVILLPEESSSWSPETVRLALLHELAHVRRLDLWASVLWMFAKAMYWFHPLVWWLSARAREEQELACDARVLAAGASPTEYAGLLVDIARHVQSPATFGCAMVCHPNLLKGRVMHILESRPRPSSVKGLVGLFISLGLIAGAGIVAIAAPDHPATANDQHVYKIGGDVSSPKVISKLEPAYTQSAKEKKIQGSVLLGVVIDASGLPKDIQVLRSLDPGLDANAIAAVTQWRFSPGMKAGKPVACEAHIEVNFRLK
ncbi:MAG TPA: M56 family metallopeptidase [Bryobacteraceae bacterium]|jgi:TonB family protein|nr:M56 family metallopeptidase [Bryobacteraceae bacterium]